MDEKYFTINIRKQIRARSVKEAHVPAIVSEDEWRDIEKQAGAYTLAAKLAEMHTNSGITQKEMTLDVSQPRTYEIKSTPNPSVSLANIRKYVEATQRAFKTSLENGIVISPSRPKDT